MENLYVKQSFLTSAVLVVIGLSSLTGCTDLTPPTGVRSVAQVSGNAEFRSAGPPRGTDAQFVALEHSVPGFAGFALDENGDVSIRLTEVARAEQAIAGVSELTTRTAAGMRKSPGVLRQFRVDQAEFSFSQLLDWKNSLRQYSLAADGVIAFDADEVHNRVTLYIKSEAAPNVADRLAARAGVPPRAIRVVHVGMPPQLYTQLTDRVRPVGAGLKILASTDYRVCTAGPIVHMNSALYVLTASHCVINSTGAIPKAPVYQQGSNSLIGTAAPHQTSWSQVGCSAGADWCRDHDVALIVLHDSVSYWKRIAESQVWGTGGNVGNLTIQTWWPVNSAGSSFAGATVYKTGQTTGTTYGQISGTCMDVTFALGAATYEVRCVNEVAARSDPGDSGAPVYAVSWDGYATATGVLSGGGQDLNGIYRFFYNDWAVVENALGATLVAN